MTRDKLDLHFLWNIFVYISIIFLVIALYRADYLFIPEIYSVWFLGLAFLTLFAGLLINAYVWKKMLAYTGAAVDFPTCVISVGSSIFGKYIPGKIWIVVGKAAYVANKSNYSLGTLSAYVVNLSLLNFLLSSCAGMVGIYFLEGPSEWMVALLLFSLALSSVLFTQALPTAINWFSQKVLKKNRGYSSMPISANIRIVPWVSLNILIWSCGFYFLAESFSASAISTLAGFGYPLAMTLGTISFISPGGLGIREGALVIYLLAAGVTHTEAVTIAAASRLWFLIGEFFIFFIAMYLKRFWLLNEGIDVKEPLPGRINENVINK